MCSRLAPNSQYSDGNEQTKSKFLSLDDFEVGLNHSDLRNTGLGLEVSVLVVIDLPVLLGPLELGPK